MTDLPVAQPRRWTRAEYEWLIEHDFFQPDERCELIDGEIIAMTPQLSRHSSVTHAVTMRLGMVFGEGFLVRSQLPLALDPHSEPEPDVAVVAGKLWDYLHAHPTTALLIVEVADSSLKLDRQRKGRLYAEAGIQDYWIVNLVDSTLEVYRDPGPGKGYQLLRRLHRDDTVSPLEAPQAVIPVADLLPPD